MNPLERELYERKYTLTEKGLLEAKKPIRLFTPDDRELLHQLLEIPEGLSLHDLHHLFGIVTGNFYVESLGSEGYIQAEIVKE